MTSRNISLFCLAAVLSGVAGCATSDARDEDIATKTHYTLKLGEVTQHPEPLPTRTDIQVTWHYSDGASKTVDGYRGWDFDGDQRFEMVEVLTDEGQVQARVFDFDGDGRIDKGE